MLLAIEDFVPVLLSAAGLWLISRWVGSTDTRLGGWAIAGTALVALGGLSKATHKLLLATTNTDVTLLDAALFPLLAAGFAVVAASVWSAAQPRRPVLASLLAAPVVWVIGFAAYGATGRGAFIGLATVGSVTLSVLLIRRARRLDLRLASWLFVVALALTIVLGGMAPTLGDAIEFQWLEQGTNTLNQALFWLAAVLLHRSAATRYETEHTAGRP